MLFNNFKTFSFYCILLICAKLQCQKIRTIDNKGTKNIVNNNNVYTQNTAPITPVENDIWFDNTLPTNIITKVYNGTTWIEVPTTNSQTVYTGFFIINAPGTSVTNSPYTFSQSTSGLPFKPSQITFTANANIESLNIENDNQTGNNTRGIQNSFGVMNGFARNNGTSISQQVIYIGGHGNSINDISRYSSSNNCIGIRYGDQNGSFLGKIEANLTSFNSNGFTLNITYTNGIISYNSRNPVYRVQPNDVKNESLVVLYTAYK